MERWDEGGRERERERERRGGELSEVSNAGSLRGMALIALAYFPVDKGFIAAIYPKLVIVSGPLKLNDNWTPLF
jgi:hypothetical protein